MARKLSKSSELERKFDLIWISIGGDRLQREYYFHPTRKWRFDRVWLEKKIAFEIEGGTWARGKSRHTTGKGFRDDCIKYNEAIKLGWQVFRLTSDMLTVEYISNIIKKAEE